MAENPIKGSNHVPDVPLQASSYFPGHYACAPCSSGSGGEGQNRLRLGTFHHQMHHRYFECNYGPLEAPWDKFFGSFHDGTAEADARIRERRKRMSP